MRLEQALEEYERKRKKAEKETEKIRKKYNSRLERRIREILKRIEALERSKLPKNIDENMAKIVSAERKNYVTALRNALGSIKDMEDLGKRLPDLAKLHVGHGKYLLIIFEKEVYAINRLLKELNEDYVRYYNELMEKGLKDLRIQELLREEKEIREALIKAEMERRELEKKITTKRQELEDFFTKEGLDTIEQEMKHLTSGLRSAEIEIRTKASKLQKPIKRMRLHEEVAHEFIRDTSTVLRKPEEFISLLQRVYPRLDGKYRKAAQWLIENLEEKAKEVEKERAKLKELEEKRDSILARAEARKKELWELERLIEEKEVELKRLRNKLEHLEKELSESIAKLEAILGKKIER
ncbi:hypothetical protein E3E36_06780 [Thermococcus sp. M36]|uniref:hypothetical protein n=1 Tax=Thermococcus sp. M36 TaxID=1638261 RepID=UPI00143BD96C|nr:hypothetical protein [Thermococcus sp. M36]NJE05850.1 hypothetical protein [Thermococcus sp. M36]